jgi:putative FmdB family regulatory protein
MPTYEYVCSKCGHEFEVFQSIADKPLEVCPKDVCPPRRWGRGKVKKKISAGAGLIFKGSGFYITDYRSEGYKEAAKKESEVTKPAGSDSKSSKPANTTTKPAAKAESQSGKSSSADT